MSPTTVSAGEATDGEGSSMNHQWHAKHAIPWKATIEERIRWHVDHAKHSAGRPIPPKLAQEIQRRQNGRPGD